MENKLLNYAGESSGVWKSLVMLSATAILGFVASAGVAFAAPIDSVTPSVTLTAPVTGDVSSGMIVFSATASDVFSSCVVTLFGAQYDVSGLKTTHSGGDIFTCGADMTALYQSQHGTNLNRMVPYLIPSSYSGVTKVEFYVDGVLVLTDTTSPYAAEWNTNTVSNGAHSVMAKAYDAAGHVGSSSSASITVTNVAPPADTQAPVASITSPLNNAVVSGNVVVSSTASDNVGVTKVELYVGGALVATDTSGSPFVFNWNSSSVSNGNHQLMVKAFDAAGNIGSSALITVSVANQAPPPADEDEDEDLDDDENDQDQAIEDQDDDDEDNDQSEEAEEMAGNDDEEDEEMSKLHHESDIHDWKDWKKLSSHHEDD